MSNKKYIKPGETVRLIRGNKDLTVKIVREYNIDAEDKHGNLYRRISHDSWLFLNNEQHEKCMERQMNHEKS